MIKTENWNNHKIRFIEREGEWWAVAKDVADALGYVPINDFLHLGETIISTSPVGDTYFALTNKDRLLYVNHFYGDSDEIQVANVAREVRQILADAKLGDCFRKMILDHFKHLRLINLVWDVIEPVVLMLMDELEFSKSELDKITFPKGNGGVKNEQYLESGVYFIQALQGLVKIGYSKNVPERFKQLQSMSPVELNLRLFIQSNEPSQLERSLHNEFSEFRKHGEWFNLDTTHLIMVNDRFNLDVSVSKVIYSKFVQ